MTDRQNQKPEEPSASVKAEAANWLARLQGPAREERLEAEFRRWLASDPSHAAAFGRTTEIWEAIGGVGAEFDKATRVKCQPELVSRRKAMVLAVCAAGAVALAGWFVAAQPAKFATGVGEQRTVRLADGSRILLNTDTKVSVRYQARRRSIRLERGEAIFDVAKNPARPFIVTSEGRDVRATGTSFMVGQSASGLAVTLLEGHVVVSPSRGLLDLDRSGADAAAIALSPGDRVQISDGGSHLDRPQLDTVTAWRRGEVVFDHTPLSTAISEMNRYTTTRLAVASPGAADLKISGVFRAGEVQPFAKTVAMLYHLNISAPREGMLLLSLGSAQ